MSASVCSFLSFDSQPSAASSSASSIHDAIQHLETVKQDLLELQDSQKQIESLRELKASLEENVKDLKLEKQELEDSINTMRNEKASAEKPTIIKKQRKSTSVKKWRRMIRTNRLHSIILC